MNKKYRAFFQYWLPMGKVKLFFRIFQVSISIAHTHIPQTTKEQEVTRKQLNQNFTHHVAIFLNSIPRLAPFKQLRI
jgi:hypothetical protein